MTTAYGSDLLALDDANDPEVIVSEELNVAQAIAHRWMTPDGTMALIGDNAPYDCFDVREYMGARIPLNSRTVLDEIQTTATQTASQDPRVASLRVAVTFVQGLLSLSADVIGTKGPFKMVLSLKNGSLPLLSVNGVLVPIAG